MALCGDYITMRPSAKKVLLLVELLWGKGWEQEPGKVFDPPHLRGKGF